MTKHDEAVKKLENFFGAKLTSFKGYIESIGIIGKQGIIGFARIPAEKSVEHSYTPDLVAKKGDEIYIVEVKVNTGSRYLTGAKLHGLKSARDFSLVPLVVNLKLDIQVPELSVKEL